MDSKNFDFPQTSSAIAELSANIAKLTGDFKLKKDSLQKQYSQDKEALAAKKAALADLQQSSATIVEQLGSIISQLDKVLDKDGTRNCNN